MTAEEDVIAGCIAAIQALRGHSAAQLSMNHYELLFYIFLHDGITRNELIAQVPLVSATTMKRYVKELIYEYDLLTEIENDNDIRVKHLHLTEKGHQIIKIFVGKMQDCSNDIRETYGMNIYGHGGTFKH
ncbi:MAG: hypothetical protein ACR2PU_01005 [Gammaproteobacteria bacterium]